MKQNEKFVYNYSAKQQKEIEEIREKYIPKKESKLDVMRKLDQSATNKASVSAITVGILSTLLFGIGMCCTMVWKENLFFSGVLIGLFGLVGIGFAFPLYRYTLKKERDKIAEEILLLSNEFIEEKAIIE